MHDSLALGSVPARGVLDALSTAVLVLDPSFGVEYLNPAAEMLLGASARRARGGDLSALLPRDTALRAHLVRARDRRESLTVRELELQVAPSASILVDCVIGPLAEPGPLRLLIEMTRLDRMQRIARETQEQRRLAANRAMLRGLAHEIKNPLGGLRGAAQLLDGELERRELREYTRIITHEADRLTRLVDRMMGPRRLPERRPLNVHEVLEHVIRLVAVEYPDRIQFTRDYDPSLPPLIGEREGLIQALLNIVRNAAQAIAERGMVTVRTRVEHQYTLGAIRHRQVLRLDIADDGPGIAPALQDQVFDPLVTGRPDGAGLGLAIAREIAGQHRGVIHFTSRPGDTRFVLHLPFDHAG